MADEKLCVRVEMEFSDGTVQTLRGGAAQHWLTQVNDVIINQAVRTGHQAVSQFDWERSDVTSD